MSDEIVEPTVKKTEKAPYIIGGLVILLYFGLAAMLVKADIPEGSIPAVHELTTTLRDAFMVFIMWMYGTTKSSARKTEIIAKSGPVEE